MFYPPKTRPCPQLSGIAAINRAAVERACHSPRHQMRLALAPDGRSHGTLPRHPPRAGATQAVSARLGARFTSVSAERYTVVPSFESPSKLSVSCTLASVTSYGRTSLCSASIQVVLVAESYWSSEGGEPLSIIEFLICPLTIIQSSADSPPDQKRTSPNQRTHRPTP
jgi:hypothetical protein